MTNEPNANPIKPNEVSPVSISAADVEVPPRLPRLQPGPDWRDWVKRLLVCNPFFLCSAALLLFAINRLSIDPNFIADETYNLLFNFSALQFYEVLLVGTAIILARRRIWYDSALLVVLENGLVLVPFLLISQATLLGDGIAWGLTLGGGAIAICRFLSLRRFFPKFNLPGRALVLGAAVLIANAALPRIFRPWVDGDLEEWGGPNLIAWWLVLPLFAAASNLLPRPKAYEGNEAERPWLPLFIYFLWIAGSAVHVRSIAHLCSLPFGFVHVGPLVFVCMWTLYNRLTDLMPAPTLVWRNGVLLLTFASPILTMQRPDLFFPLCAVNLLAYGVLWRLQTGTPTIVRELALASFALMLAGLPPEWGRSVVAGLDRPGLAEVGRPQLVVVAALLYCACYCLRQSSIKAAVLGTMSMLCVSALLRNDGPCGAPMQIALVYLLVHSIRWTDSAGVKMGRYCMASIWVSHSFFWTWDSRLTESIIVAGGAMLILVVWVIWRWTKVRGPMLYPIAALLSLLCPPVNWLKGHSSAGILALAASFLLFGIGFSLAWTKHRWHKKEELGLMN